MAGTTVADKIRIVETREYVRVYKESHSCEMCGEARAVCLDFHHRDPAKKRFALSDAETYSIKSIDAEIRKCIIVCANCHRVLHADDIRDGMAKAEEAEFLPLFDGLVQNKGLTNDNTEVEKDE